MEIGPGPPTSLLWSLQYHPMRLLQEVLSPPKPTISGVWIWKENQTEDCTESVLPAAPAPASPACSAFLLSPDPECSSFLLPDSEPVRQPCPQGRRSGLNVISQEAQMPSPLTRGLSICLPPPPVGANPL